VGAVRFVDLCAKPPKQKKKTNDTQLKQPKVTCPGRGPWKWLWRCDGDGDGDMPASRPKKWEEWEGEMLFLGVKHWEKN